MWEVTVPLSTLAVDSVDLELAREELRNWSYTRASMYLHDSKIIVDTDDGSVSRESVPTYYCALILDVLEIKVYFHR
jgi:hypothetical protein